MKQKIDDLRNEYKEVTGKDPAIRWNRKTLEKKITDARILKAGHEAMKKTEPQEQPMFNEQKPDFEVLAGGPESENLTDEGKEPPSVDRRGGPREGAGRLTGQTDRRARAERVMALEVPDLGVSMLVDGINSGVKKVTGVGIDDKTVTTDLFDNMPHGSRSLSLGITRLLYYWCPSLEGRTDLITLHLEALFLIVNPFRERAERLRVFLQQQQQKENSNVKTNEVTEGKVESDQGHTAARKARTKKRPARSGTRKKQRS